MRRYVIPRDQIAIRLPVLQGVVLWLLLDRTGASDLLQGAVWTLYGLSFAGTVILRYRQRKKPLPGYVGYVEDENDD